MTDEQIKKALECCVKLNAEPINYEICKKDCPYKFNCCDKEKGIYFEKDVLDLINRQQKTIKTLRNCVEQHHIIRKDGKSPLSLLTEEIKAEAIKEFAERLKNSLDDFYHTEDDALLETDDLIDNLVKEMVGEGK